MSSTRRFLGLGIVFGLAAGLLIGVGLTQPGRAAATDPSATLQRAPAGRPAAMAPAAGAPGAIGAPAIVTAGGAVGAPSGAATAQSATAIAYPYFGGSPGLAPDHTIVVTGVGQADMLSDGSNRAAAEKAALGAALADARVQADAIASATGLSISGVLSVSASVSPTYGVMPMAGSGAPTCLPGAPATGPGTSGNVIAPQPVCPPVPEPPYPQTLSVSATVAYRVG